MFRFYGGEVIHFFIKNYYNLFIKYKKWPALQVQHKFHAFVWGVLHLLTKKTGIEDVSIPYEAIIA